MYSNAQILSAVVAKWLEPVIQTFGTAQIQSSLDKMPFIGFAENKLKSWGLVSANYSMASELAGFADVLSGNVVSEMLSSNISKLNDATIPQMAHGVVDKLVSKGSVSLLEGTIQMEQADLLSLKTLLNKNLPLTEETKGYVVITE